MSGEEAEVTIQDLDELSQRYLAKEKEYKEQKQVASDIYAEVCKLENELLDLLEKSGKSKYFLEGAGTVYQGNRLSISIADKVQLFDHIKKEYGDEVLMGMLTINSQKLNSFYKEEVARGVVELPGATPPVSSKFVGFRKG